MLLFPFWPVSPPQLRIWRINRSCAPILPSPFQDEDVGSLLGCAVAALLRLPELSEEHNYLGRLAFQATTGVEKRQSRARCFGREELCQGEHQHPHRERLQGPAE